LDRRRFQNLAASLLARLIFFAALWSMLTEGDWDSWIVGIPVAVLAASGSVAILPPISLVWIELFPFVRFFLWRSLLGGLDVARRALEPAMPIAPALVRYRLRLPAGLGQVLMLNTVALMPGTLVVDVESDSVILHLLDANTEWQPGIEAIEEKIARLFGMQLMPMRIE
jgi:multicomponent Na+:H+ antiporter subunit E